jgi:hypothetical protein
MTISNYDLWLGTPPNDGYDPHDDLDLIAHNTLVADLAEQDDRRELMHTHAIAAILAAHTPLGTRYASPFSLAFEQAERELGERLGYPALVYDGVADKDTIASLRTELAKLTKAANLAYDAMDFQLECWNADDDDAPPSDLLNAHAALFGLLRYAQDPEDKSDELPF